MEIEVGTSVKSTPTQKQNVDQITQSEKDLINRHLNITIKQQTKNIQRKQHSQKAQKSQKTQKNQKATFHKKQHHKISKIQEI